MKQKYTVVINQSFGFAGSLPIVIRVMANSAEDILAYPEFNNSVTHIFMEHPLLEGEKGDEDWLKVVDIP